MDHLIREYYQNYLKARELITKIQPQTNHKIRNPNFPEIVSEYICCKLLNLLERNGEYRSSTRSGDLCRNGKRVEIKCFSSNGPISFGPDESWDELYLLDTREVSKYILYECPFTSNSEVIQNLKVSSSETFLNQAKQGRRPRLSFGDFQKQIKLSKISEGYICDVLDTGFVGYLKSMLKLI